MNCAYEWGDWGKCSESCGEGYQTRAPHIATADGYGGRACPAEEKKTCQDKACAIECAFEWGDWGDCSAECGGGYAKRTAVVETKSAYGGKACPSEDSKACGTDYCAVDCTMEAWGDWSSCTNACDEGTTYRNRQVDKEAAYGGKDCGTTYDEKNCNLGACAVDCEHEWGDWSECTKECGGGVKYRHPEIKQKTQYGGKECPDTEEEVCNDNDCSVDCEVSEWSQWGDCKVITTIKSYRRFVLHIYIYTYMIFLHDFRLSGLWRWSVLQDARGEGARGVRR